MSYSPHTLSPEAVYFAALSASARCRSSMGPAAASLHQELPRTTQPSQRDENPKKTGIYRITDKHINCYPTCSHPAVQDARLISQMRRAGLVEVHPSLLGRSGGGGRGEAEEEEGKEKAEEVAGRTVYVELGAGRGLLGQVR